MQQLKVGSSLQGGKYKIENVLGQGGFGITYLATQELLDRKVCIKEFFFKEYCERDEATSQVSLGTQSNHELVERFMNKFLKEVRTISQLDHRNIIKIHDIFKENNTAYYVMDYVEGESLNDMVNRRGALPEKEAVAYIERVADALKYIHQQNINHLDIKPSNIMIRQGDYRVILIDFGLSKQYDAQGDQTSTTPVGISHGYAPMEQYKQGGVSTFSPQTDIYALGATLYKLVTGNTPPQAMDILDEGLPSLPSSLSSSVSETIKKAMQPRKADRPKSIDEFLSGLNISIPNESLAQEIKTQHNVYTDEETKVLSNTDIITEEKKDRVNENPQPKNIHDSEDIGDPIEPESGRQRLKYIFYIILSCLIIVWLSKTCNSDNSSPFENNQPLTAQEIFEKGMAYYEKEDYANAIPLIQDAAERNYTYAQSALGGIYYYGKGLGKDFNKAAYWWNRAAQNGDAFAQYCLGMCYYNGEGVTKKLSLAKEWLEKSAAQGFEGAKKALQENDFGETKKQLAISTRKQSLQETALSVEEKAAVGDAEAQYQLGLKYSKLLQGSYGKKADEHRNNMKLWWSKSAEQGHVKALYEMALLYETSELDKCIKYLKMASVKGDLKSICYLGSVYERRTNLKDEAIKYYSKAANLGYAEAEYQLGRCYFYGTCINQDINRCISWYKKAANKGHGDAQYHLASCYYYGYQGLNKDYLLAANWWVKASKTSNTSFTKKQSLEAAARCHIKGGYGLSKDLNKATMLLKDAGLSANEISEFITKNQ